MLQNYGVTRGHSGDDRPQDLPERKIPGHDGQYDAQRLIADEAVRRVACDAFVSGEVGAVPRVIFAERRALFNLAAAVSERLAHFESHQLRALLAFGAQESGQFTQDGGAVGPVRFAKTALRIRGRLHRLGDCGGRVEGIIGDGFAVGGIYAAIFLRRHAAAVSRSTPQGN